MRAEARVLSVVILHTLCPKETLNWVNVGYPALALVEERQHVEASRHFPKRATRIGQVRRSCPCQGAPRMSLTGLAGRVDPG